MLATHMDAEKRYDVIRKTALRVTENQLTSNTELSFRLIDRSECTTIISKMGVITKTAR